MEIKTNDTLRKLVKRDILSKFIGMNNQPILRYYLEREDGDFEDHDGKVISLGEFKKKTTCKILLEEV